MSHASDCLNGGAGHRDGMGPSACGQRRRVGLGATGQPGPSSGGAWLARPGACERSRRVGGAMEGVYG
jgi:hypothetical protein